MRLACISASAVPSVTANSMQLMKACQALLQLGHEIRLYVPRQSPQSEKIDIQQYYGLQTSINIEWLPTRRALHRYDLALEAVRRAKRSSADLCYIWPIQAGIFSLLAGIPVILELHGPPEGRFGPLLFRLFQRLPGRKRILPITQSLAGQMRARFNTPTSLMQVSPNGVDLERYADLPDPPAARTLLGLPLLPTIGYTGHLYPGRGMHLLLELAKRFPNVSFLWVGGKPVDVANWRQRLDAEKITNITLVGFVENSRLPLFQAAADVLLMPYEKTIQGSSGGDSTTYASPMKMFEYMASKRAIISSDLPVIREVLNSSNSMLCPPEDIENWSSALGDLLAEPARRYALALQAWQDVQGYTWLERARRALAGFEK